jgi:ribosomal protein S18 acetylase RimI-like enzyme
MKIDPTSQNHSHRDDPKTGNLHRLAWVSRPYESEDDLILMYRLLMQGRFQTNDWHYPHIGDLAFWFFMVQCHLDPQQFIRMWHNETGKLVGYAILGEDPTFDCQVLPGYEYRGIEDEALAWVEKRLIELRREDAERWGGKLVSGSRQDNALRIAFLEQHGFMPGGEFSEVNMICRLDGKIPEPHLPPGCAVRSFAGEVELNNRAGAQRDLWLPWTVGEVSDEDYADFMRLPGYDSELDVVAIAEDGVIASYVNGWNDDTNHIGDFGPVGARQAYRRRGLTRATLLECMRRMQAMGMEQVSVSTTVTNEPAIRLYESVGFRVVNRFIEYLQQR